MNLDDVPAAHSMGVTWFAVDADGHVGVFSPGEAGAVPATIVPSINAYEYERAEAVDAVLEALPPIGTALLDVAGWRPAAVPEVEALPLHESVEGRYDGQFSGIMFVTSLQRLDDRVAAGELVALPGTGATAVVGAIPADIFRAIHDAGECLRCTGHGWPVWRDPSVADEVWSELRGARQGLYCYDHLLTDNWISGPYHRVVVPTVALRVEQLRAMAPKGLRLAEFSGLRFADMPHVQPVEHVACSSYEQLWLASDGRTVRQMPELGPVESLDVAYELAERRADGFDVQLPEGSRMELPDLVRNDDVADAEDDVGPSTDDGERESD
jgi:hypothetical protein